MVSAERRSERVPTDRRRRALEKVYWLLRTIDPPMGSRAEFLAAMEVAERITKEALGG
jgi:hypothetical protein